MTELLTRISREDPHKTRTLIVTITAVDTTTDTCTVDPGDGELVPEVPYFGGIPTVGSVLLALVFNELMAVVAGGGGSGPSPAAELGAGVNLNTVTVAGIYTQSQSAETSLALNYPVALAGMLEVFDNAGNASNPNTFFWQRYTPYRTSSGSGQTQIWERRFYNAAWSQWQLVNPIGGHLNFGSVGANSSVSLAVSFGLTFPEIPVVVISPYTSTPHARNAGVVSITTTGFTAYFGNWGSQSVTGQAAWHAFVASDGSAPI